MPHLRIASVNVNGIRAAARNGMSSWLDAADIDILTLKGFPSLLTHLPKILWTVLDETRSSVKELMGDKDWQANYQKVSALVESGYREIFSAID